MWEPELPSTVEAVPGWMTGGGDPSETVQVNVSVASTSVPSRTEIDVLYGLPPAAPVAMVPLIAPVAVSIDTPAGRPLAAYVSGSLSGSVAAAESETAAPSPSLLLARS